MASVGAWPALLSWLAGWSRRRRRARDEIVAEAAADAASAPALKAVIERKRRNETVRQREFDHLRQLRKRGFGGGMSAGSSQRSRLDTTQAGLSYERTQTLRKIDRVEAQMARQGWSAPPVDGVAMPAQGLLSDATPPEDDAARVSGFAPTVPPPEAARSVDESAAPFVSRPRQPAVPAVPPPAPESDAVLEEAALRWALGDAAAAAALLRAALRNARVWDRCDGARRAALFALLAAGGPAAALQAARREFGDPVMASLLPPGPAAPTGAALQGQLSGDIDAVLAGLSCPQQSPTMRLEVACARLTRVDFAAAGCLLDWAQAHQARGCQVQFRDVSPLVAAFLRVVGLTEHAQVVHAPSKPA